jgi:hypothetical protein
MKVSETKNSFVDRTGRVLALQLEQATVMQKKMLLFQFEKLMGTYKFEEITEEMMLEAWDFAKSWLMITMHDEHMHPTIEKGQKLWIQKGAYSIDGVYLVSKEPYKVEQIVVVRVEKSEAGTYLASCDNKSKYTEFQEIEAACIYGKVAIKEELMELPPLFEGCPVPEPSIVLRKVN